MGGWFRKEVKTVADLQGSKFRCGGLPARCSPLGVVPQQIPRQRHLPGPRKGHHRRRRMDRPHDDQKLGFNKVAKYYYYPGFWEGGPQIAP